MEETFRKKFLSKYRELGIPVPEWHFVLGSLIGAELKNIFHPGWERKGSVAFSEIPGLNLPSAPSHAGTYTYFHHKSKNKSICFQCGRLHGYEGVKAGEAVYTVTGPRCAGTKNFVLSNISGSLKKDLRPGTVVAIKDHINLTGQSPLTGLTHEEGFYFLDMDQAYHMPTSRRVMTEMQKQGLNVQKGVYVGVSGPQFETPAEVALFAGWGADVVGMSTVWEVMALHYSRARVSAFSVITNMATGLGESVAIIQEKFKPCFKKLIKSFFHFAQQG